MRVTTFDKEVKDIFSGNFYLIPRFQRPYSWDRENIEEFWCDTIAESEGEYFIGSVVVFKESKTDTYGIVDGQQRLTTITMILCALRNAFNNQGMQSLADGLHNFIERPDINNKKRYVLRPETSYPYFQECIQKKTKPDIIQAPGVEEELLEKAFEAISKTIESAVRSILGNPLLSEKKKKIEIEKSLIGIRDKILKLKLIFIELDNEDDAYIIFETLNTRGKDLKVSDLVKNHITKLFKPKNADVDLPKERWNKIVELIDESGAQLEVDNFIHYYWLSRYEFVTLKKIFKHIRKKIDQKNAENFLKSLEEDVKTYREINETVYKSWQKQDLRLKESLDAINLFKVKQAMPMLLSVMREYKSGRIRLPHAIEILTSIENFHFVFTAVTSQRSSGGISFMYAKAARDLCEASDLIKKNKVLRELQKKLKERRPSKEEFVASFQNILYSKEFSKQKKLVQYILARISEKSSGSPIDYEKMTIEHLASENPTASSSKIPPQFIAQLGNLLLVNEEANAKLRNQSFLHKKKILMDSKLALDKWITESNDWSVKEIRARTLGLAEFAYKKVWGF
jgi:uncharacterized protein with ParB-like and HNH nuclease domain